MKVNVQRIALTSGIIWGCAILVTTWASLLFSGYAQAFLNGIASFYPGYSITWGGSIVGLIYGFFDAFIGVYIFAFVYRWFGK